MCAELRQCRNELLAACPELLGGLGLDHEASAPRIDGHEVDRRSHTRPQSKFRVCFGVRDHRGERAHGLKYQVVEESHDRTYRRHDNSGAKPRATHSVAEAHGW